MSHYPDPWAQADRLRRVEEILRRLALAGDVDVSDLFPEEGDGDG
jgi:hypothetical protein